MRSISRLFLSLAILSLLIGFGALLFGEEVLAKFQEFTEPTANEFFSTATLESSMSINNVELNVEERHPSESETMPAPGQTTSTPTQDAAPGPSTSTPTQEPAPDLNPAPAPLLDGNLRYVRFDQLGTVYSTEGIFNPEQGSITVWLKFLPEHPRRDHSIFHTDDSRFVLYIDTYDSSEEIVRIAARAGGNHRAIDSSYAAGNFPETSIIIDNDGSLSEYGANVTWYASRTYPEGEWHHVTMAWDGYPFGSVSIYLDGQLVGEKPYDPRYDDGRPLPSALAIGFRPSSWIGELVQGSEGEILELVPNTYMDLESGGLEIADLRLYQVALSSEEILQVMGQTQP